MLHQQNVVERVIEPAALQTARPMHMASMGVPERLAIHVLYHRGLILAVLSRLVSGICLATDLVNEFPAQIPFPTLAGTSYWEPVPKIAKFGLYFGLAEPWPTEARLESCWQTLLSRATVAVLILIPFPLVSGNIF